MKTVFKVLALTAMIAMPMMAQAQWTPPDRAAQETPAAAASGAAATPAATPPVAEAPPVAAPPPQPEPAATPPATEAAAAPAPAPAPTEETCKIAVCNKAQEDIAKLQEAMVQLYQQLEEIKKRLPPEAPAKP